MDEQQPVAAAWPVLAVCGPDGRRVTVVVDPARSATVGDLADAVGLGRERGVPADVTIDGRLVGRGVALARSGVRQGSRVAAAGPPAGPPVPPAGPAAVVVTIEAGPAAGGSFALGPGRHVLGRAAAAAVRIDDPGLELRHAVLDVAPDAASGRLATITQLSGRVPWRWVGDGEGPSAAPSATVEEIRGGSVALAGSSRFRFSGVASVTSRPAELTACPGDPWRSTLLRRPRAVPEWDPAGIVPPAPGGTIARSPGSLVAGLASLVGGAVIAVVTGNPLFVLFGAVGVLGALATRAGGWLSRRRQRRAGRIRARRERHAFAAALADQRAARAAFVAATAPTLAAAVAATAPTIADAVWSRRATHDDGFAVGLGWGPEEWAPHVEGCREGRVERSAPGPALEADLAALVAAAARLADAPVRTDLGPGASLAVTGEHAAAVVRALIVQLAVLTGPADWRLVVVTGRPDEWAWTTWLPHAAPGGPRSPSDDDGVGPDGLLDHLEDGDDRHVVVVTDRPELLARRSGSLRRLIAATRSVAVVTVGRSDAVPSLCRSVVDVGSLGIGRWRPDAAAPAASVPVHVAGLTPIAAADVARRLARLHDPEDPAGAIDSVPPVVRLGDLLRRGDGLGIDDPIAVAARWRAAPAVDHPTAALGVGADGLVDVDLVRDGPHALVAGTTGSGKSELLRTLVASLAARSSPERINFLLVDYKGGSTFDACAHLPHSVGVVTDLDDRLAARALAGLDAELRRRERLLREAGVDDVDGYQAGRGTGRPPLARLVVVVDEFAALAAELPGFLDSLVAIAQRGRSLGLHLVLATQRPAGVVSDDIRANTNLRIALRLHDRAEAQGVVGDQAPTGFARGTPGRAMVRLGPDDAVVFQAATSSGAHRSTAGGPVTVVGEGPSVGAAGAGAGVGAVAPTELAVLVRTIRAAAARAGVVRPTPPWLDPLPPELAAAALDGHPAGTVGLVDDPAGQRRLPLGWDPAGGNLALIGSWGSGTTTALRSILAAGAVGRHVYVLDARGDGQLGALASHPWCGGVVGRHEVERRGRVLRLVAGELTRRQADPAAGAAAGPVVVLAIDGLSGLVDAVSGPAVTDEYDALLRILNDGPAVGIHCVATWERPAAVSPALLAAFGQRWLFHLDDPADAGPLGLRPAQVPPPIPGRLVVVASRLEAHIAVVPLPDPGVTGRSPRPARVTTLPESIELGALPASSAATGVTSITVGIDFATLTPARIGLLDGEHALVLGPPRSGRSTALAALAAGWGQAHPDGVVVVVAPRAPSPLAAWVAARPGGGAGPTVVADETAVLAEVGRRRGRCLVVVDDAERVGDADQGLLGLAAARHPEVAILAAARPDAVRSMYGHWTAVVRRSRTGLAMTAGAIADGELLGEVLPRRLPIPARPGLAWLCDPAGRRLVQVARPAAG